MNVWRFNQNQIQLLENAFSPHCVSVTKNLIFYKHIKIFIHVQSSWVGNYWLSACIYMIFIKSSTPADFEIYPEYWIFIYSLGCIVFHQSWSRRRRRTSSWAVAGWYEDPKNYFWIYRPINNRWHPILSAQGNIYKVEFLKSNLGPNFWLKCHTDLREAQQY